MRDSIQSNGYKTLHIITDISDGTDLFYPVNAFFSFLIGELYSPRITKLMFAAL